MEVSLHTHAHTHAHTHMHTHTHPRILDPTTGKVILLVVRNSVDQPRQMRHARELEMMLRDTRPGEISHIFTMPGGTHGMNSSVVYCYTTIIHGPI